MPLMPVAVGETFAKRHLFTAEDISDFAHRAGDQNPLHHDAEMAAGTRFGAVIASGTQTSALLMGLVAEYLSRENDTAGLEFTFRFRRGLAAGTDATIGWRITAVEPNAKLGGDIVSFSGEITDDDGQRYVTSEGRAVVWPKGYLAEKPSGREG
jgi:3-hydroxybutyryl-CoA dehydratase